MIFSRPHTALERGNVFTIPWNSKLTGHLDVPNIAQKHRCHLWITLVKIKNLLFLKKISSTVRSYLSIPDGSCQKITSKVVADPLLYYINLYIDFFTSITLVR